MDCPMCNGQTAVTNSRSDSECTKRKRVCMDCGYEFNTLELDADMWESMRNATKQIEERMRNNDGRR